MDIQQTYQHWKLETDSDQILWLYFDKQGAAVNTIDRAVMLELAKIIDQVKQAGNYRGLILASAKTTGFIAGADINQFTEFKSIEEAIALLRQGQDILSQLEALAIPTVAMIDGFCLGGGLEMALACHYRVAEDGAKTKIGLPEVKLGIHPGWGGTVRLPKLIGPVQGLSLILSGQMVNAKTAAKLGMIDAAVPCRQLVRAAKYYVEQRPPRHQANTLQQLANQKMARQCLAYYLRQQVRKKVNPLHYPAPATIIENWEYAGVDSPTSYVREAKTCGKLFFSETCQNLVRVFFLQEKLKSLGKEMHFEPQHIHVIGAGTMGGDIAAWCALQGMTVTLQDLEPRFIAPAIARAAKLFTGKWKEKYLVQRAMDRLIPDVAGHGIGKADLIIEAVVEDLEIKRATFKMIEEKAKPTAILATNTSSIPLDEINKVLKHPERLVGIHYFNPVAKMQLVEVVQGKKTSQDIVNKAISFVRKIDRLPLPVKSSPGFLVNRILMPYLLESMELLKEGVPMSVIDRAMVEFGMPMGPVSLADAVGLDVCLSVAHYLGQYFQTTIPSRLIELVEQRKLGRKTNEGFYKYDKQGHQIKPIEATYNKPLSEISNRLVSRLLNEAFTCLREGVVAEADLLDAGMIFGTGFAPFRGGPIHYAKSQGISVDVGGVVEERV